MNKVANITFESTLTNLCEINSSFDTGVLRICYTGDNRNKSSISKEAIEKSIKTIYNCPIVCNYDRESDTFGGHDIDIVRSDDGSLKIVNLTQPVGVIPESAKTWFSDYEEEDGTIREYLYAEVLLWKRQEAYRKIKQDGITAHSMEITVKQGESIDGIYHIGEFEFTAFALIGVEPCFESSALEMEFSKADFKKQMSEMMQDLKTSFNLVEARLDENDNKEIINSAEGGKKVLEEKMNLVSQYGLDIDSLDFCVEDFTIEELTEKFEAMKLAGENMAGQAEDSEDKFALTNNVIEEVIRVLSEKKITREWGESCQYIYVDCDIEASELYCWDTTDWLLYGFAFNKNGDSITIDYEGKKRKKYSIVDFDEGDQVSPFAEMFSTVESMYNSASANASEFESKFNEASESITQMKAELDTLRKFKSDIDFANAKKERDELFAQFEDLDGIEAFEALKSNCMEYALDEIEEKCYAIRGRNGSVAKFSLEKKTPVIKIEKNQNETEPYGGIFVKYASGS